jgi:DNA-directed RNA polymerase specialized sigma24 family protein
MTMHEATMEVDVLHGRLQAWANWLTAGGSGEGYPTKSVLHSSWLPPAPGMTATMRTSVGDGGRRERALHQAISQVLSVRLQNTLVVVYVMPASAAEQATLLDCQASTVRARVREAKALIARALAK